MKRYVKVRNHKDLYLEGWTLNYSESGDFVSISKGGRSIHLDSDILREAHEVVYHHTIRGEAVEAFREIFEEVENGHI